jgi:hypothetical protein
MRDLSINYNMNTKEAVKKDIDVQRVQKANKVKARLKKICG